MAQLRQDYQKFVERGAEIIAVGPEDAKGFANYWQKEKMPFVGLPDPKHVIAKQYGQRVNPFKLGRMPTLVVIDSKGNVRYQHYGDSMSDIPSNEEILSLLDALNEG